MTISLALFIQTVTPKPSSALRLANNPIFDYADKSGAAILDEFSVIYVQSGTNDGMGTDSKKVLIQSRLIRASRICKIDSTSSVIDFGDIVYASGLTALMSKHYCVRQ